MAIVLKLHICILIPISGSRCVLTGGAMWLYVFALIINFASANEILSIIRSIYHLEHEVSIIRTWWSCSSTWREGGGCTNLGLLMLNYQINWIVTLVICIESIEGELCQQGRERKGRRLIFAGLCCVWIELHKYIIPSSPSSILPH